MDPATGNILTEDEIEMLGKRMEDMIPLSDDVASQLIAERRGQAMDLAGRADPGELSRSADDLAPLDPRQLIAERQQATIRFAEKQIHEQEKARRRKKNKAARRARKNNR